MAINIGKLAIEIGGDTSGLDDANESSKGTLRQIATNVSRATNLITKAFGDMSSGSIASFSAMASGLVGNTQKVAASLKTLTTVLGNLGPILAGIAAAYYTIKFFNSMEESVRANIAAFEQLRQKADELGMGIEQFSRLSFAATVAGSSTEALAGALDTLAKASQNTDSEMEASTRAFAALGITVNDVSRNSEGLQQLFTQLASKFSLMEHGVQRNQLAAAIFGDKWREILPLLDRGAVGIQELIEKSDRFGATVGVDAANAAKRYTEAQRQLSAQVSLASQAISKELIPSYASGAETLTRWVEWLNKSNIISTTTRTIIATLSNVFETMLLPLRQVYAAMGAVVGVAVKLSQGDLKGAYDRLGQGFGDIGKNFLELGSTIVNNAAYVNPALKGMAESYDKMAGTMKNPWVPTVVLAKAPIMQSAEEIAKAMREATEANRVAFAELARDPFTPLSDKLVLMKMYLDSGAVTWRTYSEAVRHAQEQTSQMNQAVGQMALQDLMQDKKLPLTQRVEELNAMVRKGQITWRDYSAAMRQTTQDGAAQTDAMLSQISQGLTTVFNKSKSAAVASALINTYQGITKALAEYPPPFSYAMAGIQAAMGFAQVRQIQSTNQNSSGGGSSAAAPAAAAPAAAAAAPAKPDSTMFVKGLNPKDMLSGDMVRDLAKKLLDYQADGGKVVFDR